MRNPNESETAYGPELVFAPPLPRRSVRCPHPTPAGFLTWGGAYLTLDGRERQLSQWCPTCGALGLWSEDGDGVEWVRPGMGDCSAQDAPRTPFRDPVAGVVAGAEGEGLCVAEEP